jgi:ATP-dependent helicase/DNAse subunit B
VPFAVAATEVDTSVHIAGLTLKLRLDRIDRLNDGSLLVIDYKSGDVLPKSWDLPRPEDIQLPLYAGFALQPEEELGGLVFAKVRTANHAFAGRVGDAATTLFTGLKNTNILVKNPFTAEQLIDWRDCIQQLALDYISGRAEVDPREAPKTCQRCGLQTLCRVHETGNLPPSEDCCAGDASTEIADD